MTRTKGSALRMLLLGSSIVATGLIAAPGMVAANDADRIREGSCTGSSDWKIKASPEDGSIEIEFEVDSNVNGQTWNVRLKQDGAAFMSGQRTTHGPSGSFTVRRVVNDQAGQHHFVGRAKNPATGEICRGAVDF